MKGKILAILIVFLFPIIATAGNDFKWEKNVKTGEVKKVYFSHQEILKRDSIYNSDAKKLERDKKAELKLIQEEKDLIIHESAIKRLKDKGVTFKYN